MGLQYERDDSLEPEIPILLQQLAHDRDLVSDRTVNPARRLALRCVAKAFRGHRYDVVRVLDLSSRQLVPVVALLVAPVVEKDSHPPHREDFGNSFHELYMIVILVSVRDENPDGSIST